jgi:hypothetical protein
VRHEENEPGGLVDIPVLKVVHYGSFWIESGMVRIRALPGDPLALNQSEVVLSSEAGDKLQGQSFKRARIGNAWQWTDSDRVFLQTGCKPSFFRMPLRPHWIPCLGRRAYTRSRRAA